MSLEGCSAAVALVDSALNDHGPGGHDSRSESVELLPDVMSYTSSVTSCACNEIHTTKNGRRYNRKWPQYPWPDDEFEQCRLEFVHRHTKKALMAFHLCPLEEPRRVLDIGTGTGIWAIEYAREHPNTSVVGVDISPIQPHMIPENCEFQIDDITCEDWRRTEPYDLIHMQYSAGCFSEESLQGIIANAFKHLRPDGYLEMRDVAHIRVDYPDEHGTKRRLESWLASMRKAGRRSGCAFDCYEKYADWMQEAGFEVCREDRDLSPGKCSRLFDGKGKGLEGLCETLFEKYLGLTTVEIAAMCRLVRQELSDPDIRVHFTIVSIYGRKPTGYTAKLAGNIFQRLIRLFRNSHGEDQERVSNKEKPTAKRRLWGCLSTI